MQGCCISRLSQFSLRQFQNELSKHLFSVFFHSSASFFFTIFTADFAILWNYPVFGQEHFE